MGCLANWRTCIAGCLFVGCILCHLTHKHSAGPLMNRSSDEPALMIDITPPITMGSGLCVGDLALRSSQHVPMDLPMRCSRTAKG